MHPRVFIDQFWRNDFVNEVFVAMSFGPEYLRRWEDIFIPAIESEAFDGVSLKAIRVDTRRSGDSILTEIADGIAHSQIVLCDISVTTSLDTRHFRNGNVMYEVGLAIAIRQPVEVVLVRDDDKPLLFDLSHIPVLRFDPEDSSSSISQIRAAISDRIRERELEKDLRFQLTMEGLAQFEINMIRQNAHLDVLGWEGPSYPPAVGLALPELLKKRILRLIQSSSDDKPDLYAWTTFGRAVASRLSRGGASAA